MDEEALAVRLGMFPGLGYYVPRMTREQRQMRLVVFVRALAAVPAPFTAGAFDEWFNRMSRAPSPGDIGNAGRALVRTAHERLKRLRPRQFEPAPRPPEFTPEELADRRANADAAMIEFGFKPSGSG